ncbi:MAG: FGGY-family carbohydrate kinase [Eubacteriales bacterium]
MKTENNYVIGMDLGTTNIKAIILSESGKVAASASRANDLILPGANMAEQNADQWWTNIVSILKDITASAGTEVVNRIRGICISSHTVTMLPVDINGVPLRNAIIWMDNRSSQQLNYILDKVGKKKFTSIVGGQPDVAFLPNKLLWFKQNEPELFDKTYKVLQANSYVNYKLTGNMSADVDQAVRSQCLDIKTLKWSKEISKALDINLVEIMPEPLPVDEIIGTVTESAAKETGLVTGIPVVAGACDAMASMYAAGISQIGQAGESSGTTSLVFIGHSKASATDIPIVTKPCAIETMPYVFDAPVNTSGASIKWYLDTLGKEEKDFADENNENVYSYLNKIALESPVGSNGLLYFPYLVGERAPLWNTHSKGMFIGMSLNSTKRDFIRSIFEGTAFALRHVIETVKESGADPKTFRITGGGAKSRTWSQIKASVLNMPVHILDEDSGDVPFGAALIVGHKVGVFPDLAEAIDKFVKAKEIIEPNSEWVEKYNKLYPFYINMYKHLDSDLIQLEETMKSF